MKRYERNNQWGNICIYDVVDNDIIWYSILENIIIIKQ